MEEHIREATRSLCKQFDATNRSRDKIALVNFVTWELIERFGTAIAMNYRVEAQEEVNIFCAQYGYAS